VRIHHLALRVRDPEAAAAFYTKVVGLREVRRFAEGDLLRSVWLAAENTLLMLERSLRGAGTADGSAHLLAFAVDDLASWEDRLTRAAVPISDRTEHTLYFCDPDGHRLGVTTFPAF
jgi:catechol 2,3-dioxygenase-like lactoylglutathione lyase family enzyme